MTRRWLAALAILVWLAWSLRAKPEYPKGDVNFPTSQTWVPEVVMPALAKAAVTPPFEKPVVVGILPHHLVQSGFIARFFRQIAGQKPRRVVIFGPNHYEVGDGILIGAVGKWQTAFGEVEARDGGRVLIDELKANENYNVVSRDTSILSVLPFMKYFLPEADVVPFLIKNRVRGEQIDQWAEILKNTLTDDDILVFSTDFSHYLPAGKADIKDEETLDLMQAGKTEKLLELNNDNTDCPACLALAVRYCQLAGCGGMQLLDKSNSGYMSGWPTAPTTSHMLIVYERGKKR